MTKVEFLLAYPYLVTNLITPTALLLLLALRPPWRYVALVVQLGLIMMPTSAFAGYFEYEYWHPARLGGRSFGIEDLLCTFNIGAIGCLPALVVFGRRLEWTGPVTPRWRRVLALAVLGQSSFIVATWLGLAALPSVGFAHLVGYGCLLTLRRDLWRLSIVNAVLFSLGYLSLVELYCLAWPGFSDAWDGAGLWSRSLFNVPVGEILWATGFGLVWPLFAGFVFDLRLGPHVGVRA